MKPNPTARQRRGAVRLIAFAGVVVVLSVLVAHFTTTCRTTRQTLDRLQGVREKLHAMVQQMESQRKQADADKDVVLSLLGECRGAEDIPDFRCDRVVARRRGIEQLCLYVPQGTHVLEISSSWKPVPARGAAADARSEGVGSDGVESDKEGVAGEKTWSIPLRPASGYWLKIISERSEGPVQVELTGNHPAFESQTKTLPLERFSQRGASWSSSNLVLFPNQVEWFSLRELEAAVASPPAMKLMDLKLNGSCEDQRIEVSFAVRLRSDGPACVSASGAQRLIAQRREDLLLPYEGGGKYNLKLETAADGSARSKPQ